MKQPYRHITLSFSFLMLFIGYQICITSFTHVHYVNGVMISHSHPYADGEHSHKKTEFTYIAHISHFSALVTEAFVVATPYLHVLPVMGICPTEESLPSVNTPYFSLRAPPYFVCLSNEIL